MFREVFLRALFALAAASGTRLSGRLDTIAVGERSRTDQHWIISGLAGINHIPDPRRHPAPNVMMSWAGGREVAGDGPS